MISLQKIKKIQAVRQHLHQIPELGFQEYKTAAFIESHLKESGITDLQRVADTGIVGIIDSGTPGPTIALRADMDALPIIEKTSLPYESKHCGVMHACGHDGHMAALLGAAEILASTERPQYGKVVLVFQPAEEGLAGARTIMESGVLQELHVDEIYGFHGWPGVDNLNQVSLRPGPFMASSDRFTLFFKGKGTHGSTPHTGTDPVSAASQAIINLQAVHGRVTAPDTTCVISVGAIHGGTVGNVIPDEVEVRGTFRALDAATRERLDAHVRRTVELSAQLYGCEVEIHIPEGYPVVSNDAKACQTVVEAARHVPGVNDLLYPCPAVLGGEDFSFYQKEISGAFWFLGLGRATPLHNSAFDFNDEILATAIAMHCEIVRQRLNYEN